MIREIKEKDLDKVMELIQLHAEWELCPYTEGKDDKENLRKQIFEVGDLKGLVVEVDNQVVGYCTYIKQYSTWGAYYYNYMDCLFLHEDHRGQGWGKKIIDVIQSEGLTMQWQTPPHNEMGIGFYKHIGAEGKEKIRFSYDR